VLAGIAGERMCCSFQRWPAGRLKRPCNGDPTGDLQMAPD
jgi:hypothetical protein